VHWTRGDASFTDGRYSRAHRWTFDGGASIPASASPHIVRVPLSDPAAVDPEEAFIASLSSCHMLWFLSIAAKHGFVVDSYDDHATGTMDVDAAGRLAITHVVLRPAVTWAGAAPAADALADLHDAAHHQCFLANSVKTEMTVEPQHGL
jgi:organic hydroperoxide reductase OsmC/OhrA